MLVELEVFELCGEQCSLGVNTVDLMLDVNGFIVWLALSFVFCGFVLFVLCVEILSGEVFGLRARTVVPKLRVA